MHLPRATNKQLAPIGLRAFFRMSEGYGLTVAQQMTLLGEPSRSTFYNWKADRIAGVPHDTLSRLSYLMAIQRSLGVIFANADDAADWMVAPNAQLGGQSPMDRMLAGDLMDIAVIRQYLDGLAQGASGA